MLVLPYNIERIRRNTRPESAIVWKPAEWAVYFEDENGDVSRVAPLDVVVKVLPDIAVSLVAIFLGLKLGPAVSLAWPPLAGWGVGPPQFRRTTSTLLLAAALGIASVILIWALSPFLSSGNGNEGKQIVEPAWWLGMLASFGAGVGEEILFRLGVLTTIVWVLAELIRRKPPGPAVIWSGIVFASLLFGAMHVLIAGRLLTLTGPLIASVVIANGVISLIFGWLYWRKGLIAAMVAHTTQDIITHVVLPLFGMSL
jgi:membrane protease YdiL (CAAX protease family)